MIESCLLPMIRFNQSTSIRSTDQAFNIPIIKKQQCICVNLFRHNGCNNFQLSVKRIITQMLLLGQKVTLSRMGGGLFLIDLALDY